MERIASSSRIFDPELRTSSIEFTVPLRAITKSRVSSPWTPATAASYGYCHTSSIFRLIDAKYEMYWTSGAFSGVRRNPPPPSSVTPSFPVAFPPVPTAFPDVAPCPRPPDGSSRAITILPRVGGRSRSDFGGAPPGVAGEGAGSALDWRPPASFPGDSGASFASVDGLAFRALTGNDSSGGRSGFTGRSGTRPGSTGGADAL